MATMTAVAAPKASQPIFTPSRSNPKGLRNRLPAHIVLPKWVTSDQIRQLNEALYHDPQAPIGPMLVRFAIELSPATL